MLLMVTPVAMAAPEDVTAEEQWFVYDLNRARWDPQGYAAEIEAAYPGAYGLSEAAGLLPQPPLAPNTSLYASSGFKSNEMAWYDYFAHKSPITGKWPNGLARSYGYPLPSYWSSNDNYIEVLWASNGGGSVPPPAAIFMDSPYHTPILFQWTRHEIGVGHTDLCSTRGGSCRALSVNAASRTESAPWTLFVTGVAYDDANGNGRMDLGEGRSGVQVSAGGSSTTTNAGGGYSLMLPPGKHTISTSGAGFGASTALVLVIGHNVGVDFEKGTPVGEVRAYPSRLAGADRYATAVQTSQYSHPTASGGTVYLATGGNYPDALSAGPAAAREDAPILLTAPTALPGSTRSELARLQPSKVVAVGGPVAIADEVLAEVKALLPAATMVRRSGPTRYGTAAAVSAGAFPQGADVVYVATGLNFPDALVASPNAILDEAPLLLVPSTGIPSDVGAELTRLGPSRIVIVGGTEAVSAQTETALRAYAPTVTRIPASSRYSLSAEMSKRAYPQGANTVYVATGENYPDALAAGPAAGTNPGPLLLVTPWGVPDAVRDEFERLDPTNVVILGGPAAVPDSVLAALVRLLEP